MTDLLRELADDASAALKYEELAEEHRQRVRAKLPAARQAGAGVAELEQTIGQLYVAATISRWTSGSVPAGAPNRKRKRPGAARSV